MKRAVMIFTLLAFPIAGQAIAPGSSPSSSVVERNLANVTQASLARAIADAGSFIAAHRGVRFTLTLPAGDFDLSAGTGSGSTAISVSGIDACPGNLTIRGAGMMRTNLIKGDDSAGIVGRQASCITFSDLTLMQRRKEATQGRVVSADQAAVIVDVPDGFPTPKQLTVPFAPPDRTGHLRYWLQQYVLTPDGPQIVATHPHTRWTGAERVAGAPGRWRLTVIGKRPGPAYQPGDVIAIKAKSGGQIYRFTGGHDLAFRRVRWVNDARGKFINVNRVTIADCVVKRPAPINGVPVLMATSGGGPHIGFHAEHTSGHLVENNLFEGLGDDPIAISHADAIGRDNRVVDATRGILLVGAPDVKLENNVLIRAPVLYKPGDGRSGRRSRSHGTGNQEDSPGQD